MPLPFLCSNLDVYLPPHPPKPKPLLPHTHPQTLGWRSKYKSWGPHASQRLWGQETSSLAIAHWWEQTTRKKMGRLSFWTQEDSVLLLTVQQSGGASHLPGKPNQTSLPTPKGWTLKSKFSHSPQRKKTYSRQHAFPKWGLFLTLSWCHTIRDWVHVSVPFRSEAPLYP